MSIQTFGDKTIEDFYFHGTLAKKVGWRGVARVAARKLDMLNFAATLSDLKAPPNNRLERLKGDLIGFYSIRINDQWRIVFRWTERGPNEVRIVDYH